MSARRRPTGRKHQGQGGYPSVASQFCLQVQTSPYVVNQAAPPRSAVLLDQDVDATDVAVVLDNAKPWKMAGLDGPPVGFLHACGRHAALQPPAASISASHSRGPTKAWKDSGSKKKRPGAYRPIALLSRTGKLLERILADRLPAAAEAHGLCPDDQFKNKKGAVHRGVH